MNIIKKIVDKIVCSDPVESLFYQIGDADSARELHCLRLCVEVVTQDADERAELNRQIDLRFAQWNLEAQTVIKARWN